MGISKRFASENYVTEKIKTLQVYVTPQMYGAKGDGVTDDTQAFKDALVENDNLFLPSGNYLITDTLDISYKKSICADSGQRATILYSGSNSVVNIGRMSVLRNINIIMRNAFNGIVFDTNNNNKTSGEPALSSRVEHINIDFEVASPNATLIGITINSGTDANNIPKLTGACFQTYHDIHVDNSSEPYGYGIKMEVIQGRAFTEATKTGYPWITHIDYDDIYLGHPHTAIKSTVTNTSGSKLFERVSVGHILFNNVYTQYLNATDTQIFLDLDNFCGYFTKVMPWDYHSLTWDGKKINIIGENVKACFSDCDMAAGSTLLKTCNFTAETEFNVTDNPEYFINKYFSGSVLSTGYDSIDAKIDAKLDDAYIADIAEEKINDVLYSGYYNVLEDPLTQIREGVRWSNSGNAWTDGKYEGVMQTSTVLIPVVPGGNIIRWTSGSIYRLSTYHAQLYLFADDNLINPALLGYWTDLGATREGGYLEINNPSGYKYLAIPFEYGANISADTVTMTINREITGNDGQSYTEYLRESVIVPAVEQEVSGKADKSSAETWTFTLEDGTTVTKKVVLA